MKQAVCAQLSKEEYEQLKQVIKDSDGKYSVRTLLMAGIKIIREWIDKDKK